MNLQFDKGYAGVLIVVLSLMAAIGAGYLMNVQEVTYTKENHEQVADITGLFDKGTAPEYIEYNPSANLTGYHTTSDRNDKYFGGVEYTPSVDTRGNPLVNNYPLRFTPSVSAATSYVLDSNLEQLDPPTSDSNFVYWGLVPGTEKVGLAYSSGGEHSSGTYNPIYPEGSTVKPSMVSVRTVLAEWNIGTADGVVIDIPVSANSPIAGELAISTISKNIHFIYTTTYTAHTVNYDPNAMISQIYIDMPTNTCTVYYADPNAIPKSGLSLDNIYIAYGGETYQGQGQILSDTISYYTVTIPATQYLDITKGVVPIGDTTPPSPITGNIVSFITSPSGIATIPSIVVEDGVSYTVADDVITFSDGHVMTAPDIIGYEFTSWTPASGTITSSTTITINYTPTTFYTVTFTVDPAGSGSVNYNSISVPINTRYWIGMHDNQLRFSYNNTVIIAHPASGYRFDDWYLNGSAVSEGTVTDNITITVGFVFSATPYSSLVMTAYDAMGLNNAYVYNGAIANITPYDDGEFEYWVSDIESGYGLVLNTATDTLIGTLNGNPGDTVTIRISQTDGSATGYGDYTFTIVAAPGE